MVSFKLAAIKVLRKSKVPLHYKEITRQAKEQNLIETSGLTPEATMNTQIALDIKTKKEKSAFIRVKPATFKINPKFIVNEHKENIQLTQPTPEDNPAVYWVLFETYQSPIKVNRQYIIQNFCKHFDTFTADKKRENALDWLVKFGLISKYPDQTYEITSMGTRVVEKYFEKIHMDQLELDFLFRVHNPKFQNIQIATSFLRGNFITSISDVKQISSKGEPTLKYKIKIALVNIFTFLSYIKIIEQFYGPFPTIYEIIDAIMRKGSG